MTNSTQIKIKKGGIFEKLAGMAAARQICRNFTLSRNNYFDHIALTTRQNNKKIMDLLSEEAKKCKG